MHQKSLNACGHKNLSMLSYVSLMWSDPILLQGTYQSEIIGVYSKRVWSSAYTFFVLEIYRLLYMLIDVLYKLLGRQHC